MSASDRITGIGLAERGSEEEEAKDADEESDKRQRTLPPAPAPAPPVAVGPQLPPLLPLLPEESDGVVEVRPRWRWG